MEKKVLVDWKPVSEMECAPARMIRFAKGDKSWIGLSTTPCALCSLATHYAEVEVPENHPICAEDKKKESLWKRFGPYLPPINEDVLCSDGKEIWVDHLKMTHSSFMPICEWSSGQSRLGPIFWHPIIKDNWKTEGLQLGKPLLFSDGEDVWIDLPVSAQEWIYGETNHVRISGSRDTGVFSFSYRKITAFQTLPDLPIL